MTAVSSSKRSPQHVRATVAGNGHSRTEKRLILEWTFVVFLLGAGFLLRVWGLSRAHFWDETVYLQDAEVICCGKINYSELGSRPPLLSLFFAVVFLVWHHVYAACVATALLNALGPVFLYFSGRLMAGRAAAVLASLLLAFSPYFVGVFPAGFVSDDTGNSLLSDSPALTLLIMSLWLFLRALRHQTGLRFAWPGFFLGLAVLMRFASLSSAGLLALVVLFADRWRRAALACGAGFVASIGPYLCWSRFRYGGFLTTFQSGWEHFGGAGESPLFYLESFVQMFSWITVVGLVIWLTSWIWRRQAEGNGVVDGSSANNKSGLEGFLLFWAAGVFVFFSALPHKEPRYVMPAAAPVLLLAGIGLSTVLRSSKTSARIAAAVLLISALAFTFAPSRQRFESPFIDDEVTEEMEVSDFLNKSVPHDTVLYANFNYPVFAYYTNLPIRRIAETGPALYNALNHLPGDGILIAYRPNGDVQEPQLSWLDSSPHFHRFREFPSLMLYEYRVRETDPPIFSHARQ